VVIVWGHIKSDAICIPYQTPPEQQTRRLLHVNFLLKITMKEGIFDIQLMKRPVTYCCHCKEEANSSHLGHGRESVTIVKAINLSVPFCNQSGFEPMNLTIRANFNCIHPSATNNLLARWEGHELPSMIAFKSLHLCNHGLSPSRMIKCFIHIFGNNNRGHWG